MKLYATVASERATKGQGGNKHLYIDIMTEANIKLGYVRINESPTLGKGIYILSAEIMGGKKIEQTIYHLQASEKPKPHLCTYCGTPLQRTDSMCPNTENCSSDWTKFDKKGKKLKTAIVLCRHDENVFDLIGGLCTMCNLPRN